MLIYNYKLKMDQDEPNRPNFPGWSCARKFYDTYVPSGTPPPTVIVTSPIPILPKNENQK